MSTFSVISDVTFDLILKKMENKSLTLRTYEFGNVITSLLNPNSELTAAKNCIIHIDGIFHTYTHEEISEILEAVLSFASWFQGNILLSNVLPQHEATNLTQNTGEVTTAFLEYSAYLQACRDLPHVYFYDFQKILSKIGYQNAYNFQLGHLYQMPYTKPVIESLATLLEAQLRFIQEPEKKVIVLDCDNTLWGGVVGEDGVANLQCNKNASGITYFRFQEFLKRKKQEGFLLCLCSKNNEPDVADVFRTLQMPLKYDDFIVKKINWDAKAKNIQEIADELILGVDAFIFIDDSDFELESVKEFLPAVETVRFEKNYDLFLKLSENFYFKRKRLTTEDADKTAQYQSEGARKNASASAMSFEEYVQKLGVKMTLAFNNPSEFSRYAQMTEKTNQFNFNKEILTVPQLESFVQSGHKIVGLSVSDKFGDYGIVGLILVEIENNQATLRNYLMSCRALGRGIEDKFFNEVKSYLASENITLKNVIFKETSKNKPAHDFYRKLKQEFSTANELHLN
jgi:FkbH-like protein